MQTAIVASTHHVVFSTVWLVNAQTLDKSAFYQLPEKSRYR
jgi:hypothetical protein